MHIVVLGYYSKHNIGDTLFEAAFRKLFPKYTFDFVDELNITNVSKCDAVFIGGGSFLYGKPPIKDCWDLLISKKIFYIGVGLETHINSLHQQLMGLAQLVAIRTPQYLSKALELNKNAMCIPDLVYALQSNVVSSIKSKSILLLPNFIVCPKWNDPHWKHSSWDYFKSELAQFMDELIAAGYTINVLPMCGNLEGQDEWVGAEILNKININKQIKLLSYKNYSIEEITSIFSSHQFVITQRFHGIVLAEMTNIPYISIFHHDKLKTAYPNRGNFVSYYGVNKQILRDNFNSAKNNNFSNKLPIESNSFEALVRFTEKIIGE